MILELSIAQALVFHCATVMDAKRVVMIWWHDLVPYPYLDVLLPTSLPVEKLCIAGAQTHPNFPVGGNMALYQLLLEPVAEYQRWAIKAAIAIWLLFTFL